MKKMSNNAPLLPGLIVAGVNKAGTSSLWNYLAAHPGVAASAVKETSYWLSLRFPGEALAPLADYTTQWAGRDPALLRMEATPGYFYGGERVARAIDATCTDVKVLIVLREPSARLLSAFRYRKSTLRIPVDLTLRDYVEQCRELTDDQLAERAAQPWFGVAGGLYHRHLAEWIDVFGDRLRVIFFEDLIGDPRRVLEEVCSWLGLDVEAVEDLPLVPKNLTSGFRNARVQRVALWVNSHGTEFFGRHPAVKAPLLAVYRRLNGASAAGGTDPDEAAVLGELRAWYAEHDAGLRDLLVQHQVERIPEWVT